MLDIKEIKKNEPDGELLKEVPEHALGEAQEGTEIAEANKELGDKEKVFVDMTKDTPLVRWANAEMVKVLSSQIAELGYDDVQKTLYVEFKKGGRYSYRDVPKEVYDEFLNAESIGAYFFKNIKGKYEYVKYQKEEDK